MSFCQSANGMLFTSFLQKLEKAFGAISEMLLNVVSDREANDILTKHVSKAHCSNMC